jgi:hypothetical protein
VQIDHERAEQFVRANWSALAAAAWRLHLRYGPGALIVDWQLVQEWTGDRSFHFHPHYATRTDSKEFNAVIKDYDPQTSIVIAFSTEKTERRQVDDAEALSEPLTLSAGTALAAMTITAVPPPPEAHRARGH